MQPRAARGRWPQAVAPRGRMQRVLRQARGAPLLAPRVLPAAAETAGQRRRWKPAATPPLWSISIRMKSPAWLSPLSPKDQPTSALSGAICHRASADADAAALAEPAAVAWPGAGACGLAVTCAG